MDTRTAIDVLNNTLYVAMLIMTPLLATGLVVGLAVAILQSVTQVQEMTLTFIPKMLAVTAVMIYFMPWMIQLTMDYTVEVFNMIIKP